MTGSTNFHQLLPHFLPGCVVKSCLPLGDGNINDTYLVTLAGHDPVVLQRVNSTVFPDPEGVCDNIRLATQHIGFNRQQSGGNRKTLQLIPATNGKSCWVDDRGHYWRLLDYIQETTCFSSVQSEKQAYEGGAILGWFHHRLSDLAGDLLVDPLPGFHHLPSYCREYQRVRALHNRSASGDLSYCCRQADKRLADSGLLQDMLESGEIAERVIHGDPKIANILFDRCSGHAVALIDLDTVTRGLLQFDLGDCLRSYCNLAGEDPHNPDDICFNLDICRLVVRGYFDSTPLLPRVEQDLIYQGVRLLTYELAVRFLTDYLDNDRYFKVVDSRENLRRALSQFLLLESIERQRFSIERIAAEI